MPALNYAYFSRTLRSQLQKMNFTDKFALIIGMTGVIVIVLAICL
jgi:hypothetical protein